jgi:hypothetical protein
VGSAGVGLFTIDSSGSGPVIVTYGDRNLSGLESGIVTGANCGGPNTACGSANAGDTLTLWATARAWGRWSPSPSTTSHFPQPLSTRFPAYPGLTTASERQIQANRGNAAKSTGPVTPQGKRASALNATTHGLLSGTVVLKGESIRRFNDLAAAFLLEFQPRNSAETHLVQTMTAARWRLLRIWGIQTAAFELEMARQAESHRFTTVGAAPAGAVLAAITFQTLADNTRALALQHRFEITYERQFRTALAALLKLRAAPDPNPSYPPLQLATETWDSPPPDAPPDPEFQTNPIPPPRRRRNLIPDPQLP